MHRIEESGAYQKGGEHPRTFESQGLGAPACMQEESLGLGGPIVPFRIRQ